VRLTRAPYEQRAATRPAARRRVKKHFTLERQAEGPEKRVHGRAPLIG
jgi:hypothetical protein